MNINPRKYHTILLHTIAVILAVQGLWWFALGLLFTGSKRIKYLQKGKEQEA